MKKQVFIKEIIKNNLTQIKVRIRLLMAERMGFEPMCRKLDNRISSAARYDHFDTFPYQILSCNLLNDEMRFTTANSAPRVATQDFVRVRSVLYHFDTFPSKILSCDFRKR